MKPLQRLMRLIAPSWPLFTFAIICAIVQACLTLYVPILIGECIDLMIAPIDFTPIYHLIGWMVLAILGAAITNYGYDLAMSVVTQKAIYRLRTQLFDKISRLPIAYLDQHPHGDLVARQVSDVEMVSDGLLEGFKQLYRGILTITITLIFMLIVKWVLALVVLTLTPFSLLLARRIARRSHRLFEKQSALRGEVSSQVLEAISQQRTIKAFNQEEASCQRLDEVSEKLRQVGEKAVFLGSTVNPTTRFMNGLVYAAVGVVGAILIIKAPASMVLTVGQLSSFLFYSNQYAKPFNEISSVVSEWQTAMASLRRIGSLLEAKEDQDLGQEVLSEKVHSLSWDHVTFGYQEGKTIIKDFSFEALPGKRIAIVGPTGCGKTTLINLLMRFYEVNEGQIVLNDHNLQTYLKSESRRPFGMVLQDTWIFQGTVAENVGFGKENATREEIVEACRKAHALGFIKRLPLGFETIIDAKSGLSQGEMQLLAIARVMLRNPEIVILDEATSSIDTRTEMKITDAFEKLMAGKTSFIIAHRLSTIRRADCIIVMKDGQIVETGTHEELLSKHGFYAELYQAQFAE